MPNPTPNPTPNQVSSRRRRPKPSRCREVATHYRDALAKGGQHQSCMHLLRPRPTERASPSTDWRPLAPHNPPPKDYLKTLAKVTHARHRRARLHPVSMDLAAPHPSPSSPTPPPSVRVRGRQPRTSPRSPASSALMPSPSVRTQQRSLAPWHSSSRTASSKRTPLSLIHGS